MKKHIVGLAVLIIFSLGSWVIIKNCNNTAVASDSSAVIGSFNTLHLGWKGKNVLKMAEVVKHFQLVGLQEVMNERGIIELTTSLQYLTRTSWKYHISPYSVGSGRYKEYYGYVWRVDRVKFIKPLGYYKEIENEFIREPYGAIFLINKFDFTFVLCHLVFGKRKSDRRNEAGHLCYVYNHFQYINGVENDVIIAGDFNLPANDKSFINLYECYGGNILPIIYPKEKTTIGKNGLVSSYDNFFYNKICTREIKYGTVYKYITNNYSYHRESVSDHLPIFIVVNTSKDDD